MPNEFFSWALITLSQQFYYLNSKFNGAFYYFFQGDGGGGGAVRVFQARILPQPRRYLRRLSHLRRVVMHVLWRKGLRKKKVIKLRAYFVRTPQWRGGKLLN